MNQCPRLWNEWHTKGPGLSPGVRPHEVTFECIREEGHEDAHVWSDNEGRSPYAACGRG